MGKVVKNDFFKKDTSDSKIEEDSAKKKSEPNTKPVSAPNTAATANPKAAPEMKAAPTGKTFPAGKAAPAGNTAPTGKAAPAGTTTPARNTVSTGKAAPAGKTAPAGNPNAERKIPAVGEKAAQKPVYKPVGGKRISPMRINRKIMNALKEMSEMFYAFGRRKTAKEIENIYFRGSRNLFTVSVVGEFSRGKSTFINNMLGKNILPVGDLPTTAMLTRIRYAPNDAMVHIDLSGNMIEMPPEQNSWKGLVADNFGHCDPEGVVHIGLRSQWLGENNVEIIDTPGAGDLEEKRAQTIGEALLGSDGAIITINAASPLSLTEKTFIEERLISRKTPFLMLIITKLDTIPKRERASMVEYIKNKLKSWKMDIPVFIPNQVEIDGDKFSDIMGFDKIKEQIIKWINDPGRVKLTEAWISAQAISVLERELIAMKSQMELIEIADDKKRAELIEARKSGLAKTEEIWDNLCEEMRSRSGSCFSKTIDKVNEMTRTIIERLQYEVGHASVPEKWWKEDYPYRLKIELTNLSVGVTNVMSRVVTEDTRWLNAAFEQNFKARFISNNAQEITAEKVESLNRFSDDVQLSDIDKQRKAVKIGSSLLTIVGTSATVALNMSSLVWTMGVGTAISLVSEAIFKKELDGQRDNLKQKIADDVPQVISESIMMTKSKIEFIYDDILNSATEKKKEWTAAQATAIENSVAPQSSADTAKLKKQIEVLENLLVKLTK